MAKPVEGYVECPECQGQMAVKKVVRGRARTLMLSGYCGCGHQMQKKEHQEYLKGYRAESVEQETPSESPVETTVDPAFAEYEGFDPAEITPAVDDGSAERETETPAREGSSGGGFVKAALTLGALGLCAVGLGKVLTNA